MTCDDCRAGESVVRMSRAGELPRALCLPCADKAFKKAVPGARISLVDFWVSLANPRPAPTAQFPDSLPDDSACPTCQLTFREFTQIGLAGCGTCYSAFAAVILPALTQLHTSE